MISTAGLHAPCSLGAEFGAQMLRQVSDVRLAPPPRGECLAPADVADSSPIRETEIANVPQIM
jgi:hypothetical protein